jgi:hypothetical protein
MPRKWQIFKVVSIIQFAFLVLIIVLGCISFIKMYEHISITNENMIETISGFLIFIAALPFHALCIQMAIKFYPDKEIPLRFNIFFAIAYIIAAIGEILLIIVIVMALNNITNSGSIAHINIAQKTILILFFLYVIANLYSFIYAIKFRKFIDKNFIEKQNHAIETLGSSNIDLL